jgi:hypothetical protein
MKTQELSRVQRVNAGLDMQDLYNYALILADDGKLGESGISGSEYEGFAAHRSLVPTMRTLAARYGLELPKLGRHSLASHKAFGAAVVALVLEFCAAIGVDAETSNLVESPCECGGVVLSEGSTAKTGDCQLCYREVPLGRVVKTVAPAPSNAGKILRAEHGTAVKLRGYGLGDAAIVEGISRIEGVAYGKRLTGALREASREALGELIERLDTLNLAGRVSCDQYRTIRALLADELKKI